MADKIENELRSLELDFIKGLISDTDQKSSVTDHLHTLCEPSPIHRS